MVASAREDSGLFLNFHVSVPDHGAGSTEHGALANGQDDVGCDQGAGSNDPGAVIPNQTASASDDSGACNLQGAVCTCLVAKSFQHRALTHNPGDDVTAERASFPGHGGASTPHGDGQATGATPSATAGAIAADDSDLIPDHSDLFPDRNVCEKQDAGVSNRIDGLIAIATIAFPAQSAAFHLFGGCVNLRNVPFRQVLQRDACWEAAG